MTVDIYELELILLPLTFDCISAKYMIVVLRNELPLPLTVFLLNVQ